MEHLSDRGIIFPSDPFDPHLADEEFRSEAELVSSLGGKVVLVDHTEIVNDGFKAYNAAKPFELREYESLDSVEERSRFRSGTKALLDGSAFYRGWMMPSNAYALMEQGMEKRLISLRTSEQKYTDALYFFGWYDLFSGLTPSSVWFPAGKGSEDYLPLVENTVGEGPFFVKDLVKSRKHEWDAACYAPDLASLPDVVSNLIRLQGADIASDIVVRKFETFRKDQGEVRVWWVDGTPVMSSPHPDTPDSLPEVDQVFLEQVRRTVNSFQCPFVTTDLAQREDGAWRIIEVSDGQVSGVPRGFDPTPLYQALLGQ